MGIKELDAIRTGEATAEGNAFVQKFVRHKEARFHVELVRLIASDKNVSAEDRLQWILALLNAIPLGELEAIYSDSEARSYLRAAALVIQGEKKATLEAEIAEADKEPAPEPKPVPAEEDAEAEAAIP